jgi:hypothetical protein
MSHAGEFNRILDKLYERRTDALRRILSPKQGRARTLTKRQREHRISELQNIVSTSIANSLARREFAKAITEVKTWPARGGGREAKRKQFRQWVREEVHKKRGKVYIFWRGDECRYVGRTRGRGTRPSHHFRKGWFTGTTRIDVYVTEQKRSVPSVECLAMHRFQPTRNRIRASKQKWTPRCPLCKIHKTIRAEVRKIYRFR